MTVKEKKDLLDTLAEFFNDIIKPDMEAMELRLNTKIDKIIDHLRIQESPSREEFQNLKYKVEKIEASN